MQTIRLSTTPGVVNPGAYLSQYDVGRQMLFLLYDDVGKYIPAAGSTVHIRATKPSGFGFDVACIWSQNSVTVTVTDEMSNESGSFAAELRIEKNGNILGTANFLWNVERSTHLEGTIDGNEEAENLYQSLINAINNANAAADAANQAAAGVGRGISEELKQALLQLASKVVYIDEHGQTYYDDLYEALYPAIPATSVSLDRASIISHTLNDTITITATVQPPDTTQSLVWASSDPTVATVDQNGVVTIIAYGSATITATAGTAAASCSVLVSQITVQSISAVYTQSGTVYDTDSLNSLKDDLVVTATWSDSSQTTVPASDYSLSGTLTTGTSTITVSYGGKATTFNVTVTHAPTMYSVTNVLTHVSNSNIAVTSVEENDSYAASLGIQTGYTMSSVVITMGGIDVTSTAYDPDTRAISIAAATGNIVITAVAIMTPSSITAVYTQSGTVYDTDSLDSLKANLVVTANYPDSSTETVPAADYALSGSLTVGTSTITVTYAGLTDTFTVTVTEYTIPMLYKWDFTQSLTDEVEGVTVTSQASYTPTRDSTGLHFTAARQQISVPESIDMSGKTLEVDLASFSFAGNTSYHIRFIMLNPGPTNSTGTGVLIYKSATAWSAYGSDAATGSIADWSSAWSAGLTGNTDAVRNAFNGKTVKIVFDSDGHTMKLYIDGVLEGTISNKYFSNTNMRYISIGGLQTGSQNAGNQFFNATITGMRIYENQ